MTEQTATTDPQMTLRLLDIGHVCMRRIGDGLAEFKDDELDEWAVRELATGCAATLFMVAALRHPEWAQARLGGALRHFAEAADDLVEEMPIEVTS